MLQIFRFPNHASACAAVRALHGQGLTTRAGVRHHQAYLTVRSERTDVATLVRDLEPTAVPVNLEHLPAQLPQDVALVS